MAKLDHCTFREIIKRKVLEGYTLTELSKKLGYTSPSILSMLLNGKRSPSSKLTLLACQKLDLKFSEKLALLNPSGKRSINFIEPYLSGKERKEFFKYLNGDRKIPEILKFKRLKEKFECSEDVIYQDNLNFPFFFQAVLNNEDIKDFEEELGALVKILLLKYFDKSTPRKRKVLEFKFEIDRVQS